MWKLNPEVIIRPEAHGGLFFNPSNAETAYLDKEGLGVLIDIVKGKLTDNRFHLSYFLYLKNIKIIQKSDSSSDNSLDIIERCMEEKVFGLPHSLSAPETLHISLTDTCDQNCPGCFYSKTNNDPGKQISRKMFLKIIKEAKLVSVFQLALGGGEPLLHPDLLFFVKESKKMNIVPNITTNGNLLTLELAKELKKARLGQIQISLDGSDATINGKTRPNYQHAVKAMNLCRKAGLRFGINTLVTRDNFRSLPSLFRFAHKVGAEGVNLLRPKPPVNSSDWLKTSSLSPKENREFHILLLNNSQIHNIRITLDQSLSFLAFHRDPEELFSSGVWGCGAGSRFITIDPEGIIFPCSHYRKSIGKNGEFMNAWKHSELLNDFRQLEDKIKGQCKGCRLLSVCRGCRAVVTELGGGFFDEDPHCPSH